MNPMQRVARSVRDPFVLDFTRCDRRVPSSLITFSRADAAPCAVRRRANGAIGPGRTNYCRNSSDLSGTAGSSGNGITIAPVGSGTISMLGQQWGYVDLQVTGTQGTAGTSNVIGLMSFSQTSDYASVGDQLCGSAYVQLVSAVGSLGTGLVNIRTEEATTGNVQIAGTSVDSAPLPGDGNVYRLSSVRQVTNATGVRGQVSLRVGGSAGATYNFTVRVYAPQLERGVTTPTPAIRTTAGTGSTTDWPRMNKCANFNSPNAVPSLTGMSTSNASLVLTVVDDSTALARAGIPGRWAFMATNSDPSNELFVRISGSPGNLMTHTGSAWIRGDASRVRNGYAVGTAYPASTGYVRRTNTFTPGDVTDQLWLGVPANGKIYFTLNQLEEGGVATAVIPTAGAAAIALTPPSGDMELMPANEPRIDYTADGLSRGLLIEAGITNAVVGSRGGALNISYNPSGITQTANYPAFAPDGTWGVSRFQLPAGNAPFNFQNTSVGPGAAGAQDCQAIWMKPITLPDASFTIYAGNSTSTEGQSFTCTVTGGKVSAISGGGIVRDMGDGWQRLTLPYTTGGAITMANLTFGFGAGGGARELYFWNRMHYAPVGGQVGIETSDVLTDASAKTRLADDVKVPNLASVGFNSAGWSCLVEWEHLRVAPSGIFGTPFCLRDASGQTFLQLYVSPSTGNLVVKVMVAGVAIYQSMPTAYAVTPGVHRVALALAPSGLVVSANGVALGAALLAIPMASFTELWLGSTGANSNVTVLHGWLRKFKGWSRVLTMGELQAESA